MNRPNNSLFKRDRFVGVRLIVMVAISIVIMMVDHRGDNLKALHNSLSILTSPIHYLVDLSTRLFNWTERNFSSHEALITENTAIKNEQVLLRAKLQKFQHLEQENKELRSLLKTADRADDKIVVAELLSVTNDPFVHQITIDKGESSGIYKGQPVLDANGIMGQVIHVSQLSSTVLLLNDSRSAIPVVISRNGLRGVVVGSGNPSVLNLVNVPKTVDIQIGDELMTSGLGGIYPAGYSVGRVTKLERDVNEHFATIKVSPSAKFSTSRLVIMIWPGEKDGLLHKKMTSYLKQTKTEDV